MSGMTRWGFAPLLIIGFLFMAACSGTGQQAAFAQVCDGQVNPEITVTVPPSKPVEDHRLDVAALSARDSLDKTVPALKDYRETFGTTAAELKAHLNGDMRADPKGNHWCAQLVRTTVKVDWITTVYLARELEPGSCPLAAVQAHEAKHVALDRELLPMMKQDVETAVRGVTRAPVWGTSANEAMAALKARIEQAAKAAIDDFEKQRDARQLLIDTPEEYDRVSASCGKDAFSKLGIHASTEM